METRAAIEALAREAATRLPTLVDRGPSVRSEAPVPPLPAADSMREVDRMVGWIALSSGLLPAIGQVLAGSAMSGEACVALLLGLSVSWLLWH